MQTRRHDSLQILENFCPGESFTLEKVIEELRPVAGAAVFRPVQQRFGLCFFLGPGGNLRFALSIGKSRSLRADPTG